MEGLLNCPLECAFQTDSRELFYNHLDKKHEKKFVYQQINFNSDDGKFI